MHDAHDSLAALDLNLVRALDVLLAERHVTRAAAKLGITQSAASHALARLRAQLGDPLLVRGPRGTMLPTPRAERLGPAVRAALLDLRAALRGDAFDPATARHTFRIAAGDYVETVLLPPLAARLGQGAPGIDLWVPPLAGWGDEQLASGELDLVFGPPRGAQRRAGVYERALFEETFTCIVRAGHPLARGRLTLARYAAASHLLVAPRGTPGSFVDDALAAHGVSRRVAIAVPHFLVVPPMVAQTDLIATLPARVAALYRAAFGLVTLAPPVPLPPFQIAVAWSERSHHAAPHRWLRDQLIEIAARS